MKGNGTERHQPRGLSRALVPDLVLLTVLSCPSYVVTPIRYVLAGCLLRQDNDSALKELLAAHEDASAFWLYTRALVAFRESGDGDEQAAALVKDAWSANEHVPAILAGRKPAVIPDDGYVTMGGPDEATYYVTECGVARGIARRVRSRGWQSSPPPCRRNGGHVRRSVLGGGSERG